VPITKRSKLYYTASGIITKLGGHPVQSLREDYARDGYFRCDDTRCCIIEFRPLDDEHIVLDTCRKNNKLIIKRCCALI